MTPSTNTEALSVDDLAQEIRSLAWREMGAGLLAEKLMPFFERALSRRSANSAVGWIVTEDDGVSEKHSIDHHAYRVAHIDPLSLHPTEGAEPVAWGLLDANGVVVDANVMKSQFEYLNTPDRVIPLRPATPVSAEVTATHRHVKRGSEYVLIGIGKMQAEKWVEADPGPKVPWGTGKTTVSGRIEVECVDMREVAIYRSVDDGSLWARPREEFEDGRFAALASINGGRENG